MRYCGGKSPALRVRFPAVSKAQLPTKGARSRDRPARDPLTVLSMSSTVAAETPSIKPHKNHRRSTNVPPNTQKKLKGGRKRSKSFSGCGMGKMKNPKPVLPTKFLLGGNINDPLNLNSLQDEEINRAMNAVTPKSSPVPTPPRRRGQIEVIIPPNINDPLNLIDCADDAEYEQQLCSPVKRGRKKKPRKRRTTSGTCYSDVDMITEAKTPEANKDSAKIPEGTETCAKPKDLPLELSPKKEKNKRKSEDHKDIVKKLKISMDKIVSPVIPQPGAWLKRNNNRNVWQHRHRNQNKETNLVMPQFKEKSKQYQYGNYNRYYGYRNTQIDMDHRLKCFLYNRDLFEGKDILDIGCNIGHITLSVARDLGAHSIVGIDIDKTLITIARKNVKHYVSSSTSPVVDDGDGPPVTQIKSSEFFPISMPILYGPIDIPGFGDKRRGQRFPNNVTFVQGNYVPEDDALISTEQPQFDVILCLSITKWIHLNWGDAGIKRAFRRMYAQLRPGGKLILEPQNWASYKRKKKLTETIYKNYNTIEFFPEAFTQYLLSPEVGFAKAEMLGRPHHQAKGFQRPIQVFTKSTMFPSERVECSSTGCSENSSRVYAPLPSSHSNSCSPAAEAQNCDRTECRSQDIDASESRMDADSENTKDEGAKTNVENGDVLADDKIVDEKSDKT